MSSTEVELITSVLSATAGNIARTISAPSVLITLDTILVTLRGDREPRPHEDVGLAGSFDSVDVEGVETWSQLDRMRIVELGNAPPAGKPFHRWMKTLHRRAAHRRSMERDCKGPFPAYDPGSRVRATFHHRHSSSGSSTAFVTGMKSASVSVAGTSFFAKSRRNTMRSSRHRSRTDKSSAASVAHPRLSTDSTCAEAPIVMDQAVTERALQRRRILEELIETEESYIADVRFLMNVYITILASLPTLAPGLRSSINHNLTAIIQLHEELLGDLHRAVPHSEYSQLDVTAAAVKSERTFQGHQRWKSLDAVLEDKASFTLLQSIPGMTTEPQVAAEVAKVFSRKMNRFFIYEEYGAKYELMIKDVASAHRTMSKWESYQKGLETLAAALSTGHNQDDLKKSLTIGDLLVKPIQRVCRYPLLFAELLKCTPVCDCPHSHMEVEAALVRLREATAEINRATDDTRIKATLEKTWILQDRLVFPNQSIDAASKNQIRSLGHIQLCGALHVCWQTKDGGVNGQYMVSLLYRDWLCLAVASRADQIYTVHACINITTAKIEDVDNGRGIQCHTAPYSWKLVFLCDHQLYEIIMTACTPREEREWRTRLTDASGRDGQQANPGYHQPPCDSLAFDIKALGTVFGKQGTIARRISVHRATTVGPTTPLCQVILRNTSTVGDAAAAAHHTSLPSSSSSSTSSSLGAASASRRASISRSMSLLTTVNTTTNRVPVLAPARAERARLEALLSDVWTRDVLPFPGITARSRSEYLATSMMQRLSVASLTGSFGRKSHSGSSTAAASSWRLAVLDDGCGHQQQQTVAGSTGGRRLVRSEPAAALRRRTMGSIPADDDDDEGYPPVETEWGLDVLRTAGVITDSPTKRQREDADADADADAEEGKAGVGRTRGSRRESPHSRSKKRIKIRRTLSTLRQGRAAQARVSGEEEEEGPADRLEGRKSASWRAEGVVRGLRSLFQ